MKNIYLLFILLVSVSGASYAQAPGFLDPTFGNGGKVTYNLNSGAERGYKVMQQTDGKLVVAGYSTSVATGKDFLVLRYLDNGTLDPAFGTNGVVQVDIQPGSEDEAHAMDIQTDGKIVIAGFSDNGIQKDGAVIRLLTDGTIDSTFGANGRVVTDFDSLKADNINTVKVHVVTGKIVVGGESLINTVKSRPVVARYLANGTPDSTLNGKGVKTLWISNLDYQYLFRLGDIGVSSNGKITACGSRDFPNINYSSDYWACRINADGTPDVTFSTDGTAIYNGNFNGNDYAEAMILRSNGNFVIGGGGDVDNIYQIFTALEITTTGAVDWSVGVPATFAYSDESVTGLGEDLDGNIVLAGTSDDGTESAFKLARMLPTPAVDDNFGVNGVVTTTFGNAVNKCNDMTIQADNKIVAVGFTGNNVAIARYLGTGIAQLDSLALASPANLSLSMPLSISLGWTTAYGATGYEIMLDSSANFTANPQTYTSSTTGKAISGLVSGTNYFWKVRATDGTNYGQWTGAWKFTTNTPTGIADLGLDMIEVYPNPASNSLYLQTNDRIVDNIRIFSSDGQLVKEFGPTAGNKLDISSLANGIYLVEIKSSNATAMRRWAKM